jgi:hypothetical protein
MDLGPKLSLDVVCIYLERILYHIVTQGNIFQSLGQDLPKV